ncbi:dnaJ homolog subfamily C member 9 [Spodoptera frugiperda]|uniref:DnaJ homolog subfamily C member 9 n=1 Tax=Spodoptera frugiperda TaxID=7108 RepID=A0A9R0D3J6_SPOFR|nr:dnaJ homolog subfamily C member 9 [Spodoptera frugiperda]
MGLLELCEKYFQTTNLYEVLQIPETASDKEVKKAYHKLSLKVHPDRVEEAEKLEATEKFKVLGSIHAILTDKEKKAIYDETKCVDDDDFNVIVDRDWSFYWRVLFKKITDDDIRAYEKEYVGSEQEKKDIKQVYLNAKGDMNYIVDHVQFARTDQEPRIREIINEMIKSGEVPEYKIFTHEPASKRLKRIAKEKKEAKLAEEMQKEMQKENPGPMSLELSIKQKQKERAQQIDSFIDGLAAKYGGTASKPKANKRKSSTKPETAVKNKRRR